MTFPAPATMYRLLLLVSFLLSAAQAQFYEDSVNRLVAKTNNQQTGWRAGYNEYFAGKSLAEMKSYLGARVSRPLWDSAPRQPIHTTTFLPKSFVSGKDKWSKCASTINFIKDQSSCGSCWAVSASEVMADRTCIANYDAVPDHVTSKPVPDLNETPPLVDFSAIQMVSCCTDCGKGCAYGYAVEAFKYWVETGVVSGGWYGSECGCQPYPIQPDKYDPNTPACSNSCGSWYKKSFQQDKHKGASHYTLGTKNVTAMQTEIYENGPIVCIFEVYENFYHYKSGVYYYTEGNSMGWHAVKVIGWGEDNGLPYWLINNSWNTTWGDDGQFKYYRGINFHGIEEWCSAGKAKSGEKGFLLKCPSCK